MTQPDLFSASVAIPSRAPVEMRPRLSRQCLAILARLQQGCATNRQLSALALNYKARVSELRQAGYVIDCQQNRKTGLSFYRLGER